MSGQPSGVVLPPGEGEILHLGLSRPTVKVGAAIGSTRLGVIDSWLPPGGGFHFPHWHEDLEEAFYVLEGEIDYLTGTTWVTAGPGSTVFVPATVIHAFRNTSGQPARHLAIGAPRRNGRPGPQPRRRHSRPVRGRTRTAPLPLRPRLPALPAAITGRPNR